MATRSNIAYQAVDGTIHSIYCHWDGYPEHNGKILNDHYTNIEKIKQLIELGSLSSLGPEIGESHDFDARYNGGEVKEDWVMAYHRDRGEELRISVYDNVVDWIDDMEEYAYLWDGRNWLVNDHGEKDGEGYPVFDLVETKMRKDILENVWN